MLRRLTGMFGGNGKKPVKEIIGRSGSFWDRYRLTASSDDHRTDYEFWDKLRWGQEPGFQLSGLFAARINRLISAWALADGFTVKLADIEDEYTETILARWSIRVAPMMLAMAENLYALGDQFVFVNADRSISIPSPDTVDIKEDRTTGEIIKATVITRDDSDGIEITYTYEPTQVTVKVKEGYKTSEQVYPNPLGVVPMVQFANDRATNERFGRPIIEPMFHLLAQYDDVLEKSIMGGKMIGTPLPVMFGLKDPNQTRTELSDSQTYYDASTGEQKTRYAVRWDFTSELFLGEGADFKFAGPDPQFPDATKTVLRSLFELLMDHTGIPEFVWGGAISSSKASAEVQMPPFLRYIKAKRKELQGVGSDRSLGAEDATGLLQLSELWLRTAQLTDPRIVVDDLAVEWPELTPLDRALNLEWARLLWPAGVIRDETVIQVSELPGIDDAATEVQAAQNAAEERQAAFEAGQTRAIDEALEDVDRAEGDGA